MAEPLSVVASSFAVVGLADVVIRAGNHVYQFLSAIKDAPEEVKKLQTCIHDSIDLAKTSKDHWEQARQLISTPNPAATTPLSKTLPQFKSALEALNRELSVLQTLTKRYKGVPTMWGRVKFVFDDRRIQRSLQRLEASKSNLVIALVLIGRQQDLLSQKGIEHNIQEALGRQIEEFRKDVRIGQANLEDVTCHLTRQTDVMKNNIININQNIIQQHKKTRVQLTQETTNTFNVICSKLDGLSREVACAQPSAKSSGRKIWFYGNNREDVLCPLLLLRPELQRTISDMVSRQSRLFSTQDLYWLQSEFESLVASATQEVAAISHGSTATSFDDWSYPQGVSSFLGRDTRQGTLVSKKRSRDDFIMTNKETEFNKTDNKRRRLGSQSFLFELAIGTLEITIPRLAATSPTVPKRSKTRKVEFSFIPQSDICSTSLRGYFVNPTNVQPKPCLYAQLNAFNIVPGLNDELLDIFYCGTLEEIDSAFRLGKISPYDVTEKGLNTCLYASAVVGRIDVFQYLDNHGIGILSLKALKETEYDFEQSCDGLTTLAMQLTERGRFSVEVAGIMLDCGANAHAICQGLDMFRFPMFRCEKESDREVLEQKFCLLIRAGVDVNFEDEVGMTTSECALEFGCWDEWCRALESNNLNIHEVIEMDEKRREHFRAQRMGETDPEDAEETDAEDDRETDAEDDETETGPEIDSEYGTEDVKENSMDGDTQQR